METAFLAHVAAQARQAGARRLQGWFLPTKKNAPARDFYSTHGFHLVAEESQGSLWEYDLTAHLPACPEWIRVAVSGNKAA